MTPDAIAEMALIEVSRIQRETLGDAWRGCLREVDDRIFYIQQDARSGKPSPSWSTRHYLDHVRRVSQYEERMVEAKMGFEK